MAMFGGIFHDYLDGPWDEAKGFLKEELEQLRTTLMAQWNAVFGENGFLTADAIQGDSTITTVYVSNEGDDNAPYWAKVNLVNGVKGRLRFSNMVEIAASSLLGRGSAAGTGDIEVITIGTNLEMDGTTLNVISGATLVPMTTGAEPLEIMSNGDGTVLLIEFEGT